MSEIITRLPILDDVDTRTRRARALGALRNPDTLTKREEALVLLDRLTVYTKVFIIEDSDQVAGFYFLHPHSKNEYTVYVDISGSVVTTRRFVNSLGRRGQHTIFGDLDGLNEAILDIVNELATDH